MSVTLQPFKSRLAKSSGSEKSTIAETRGDRIFLIGIKVMLWIALIAVAVPLIYVVASSFSSASAVSAGRVLLWPVEPSLAAYKSALTNPQVLQGYYNSLIYAIGGTLISVTLTVAIAYPLSRKTFFGRNLIMSLLIFTDLPGGAEPRHAEHPLGIADPERDRRLAGDHRADVLPQHHSGRAVRGGDAGRRE
jgi:putative aldouronate transport system permease protein